MTGHPETAGGAVTLDELPAILARLEALIREKERRSYGHACAFVSGRGGASIALRGISLNRTFSAPTLTETLRRATEWLHRDDAADLNETLGLTRDGRFVVGAAP